MSQKVNLMLARLFTRFPLLGRLWSRFAPIAESTDVPWTMMHKPLTECRVCLITTGGLHLKSDPPFNMEDSNGDPTYRMVPSSVTAKDLAITHHYYDHKDADRDFNLILPIERLRDLAAAGHIAGLAPTHYSFMGHIDGPHVATLQEKILPELIERLKREQPDFVFLTPA